MTNATAFNASLSSKCDTMKAESTVFLGISLGLLGSIGINVGQNLQAVGLRKLDPSDAKARPWKSPVWRVGFCLFILGSLVNFAAFVFASASILVCLEAVQYVCNVAFSKFVNKVSVSRRCFAGVVLAVCGTALTVSGGPKDTRSFEVDQLQGMWSRPHW